MPQIPPEALMAALGSVHQTGLKTDPNTGQPYDQGSGGGGAAGGDPNAGAGDSQAPGEGQGDPTEQAIWDAFPSTDPDQIDQLAQQYQTGGDPGQLAQLVEAFMQQAQQDRDDFEQRQEVNAQRFFDAIGGGAAGAPDQSTAAPQDQAALAPPGVGGGGAGY